MIDPNDYASRPLFDRIARLRRVTAWTIAGERIARAFLPLFTWMCFFAGLWLIAPAMPAWAHQGISALFFIGAFFLFLRGVRAVRWPARTETDLRLQEQSGVKHRPLAALGDTLAHDQGVDTRALWDKSRDTLPAALGKLRMAWPRPVLAFADPMALRILAVLVLIVGIVMAGGAWDARLRAGLWPFAHSATGLKSSDVATLTITPPAYTGRETLIVRGRAGKDAAPIDIAEGSTIKAQVTGGFGTPVLSMDETDIPLEALDDKSFRLETAIVPGETISLTQTFLPRVRAPYRIVPDTEPGMALAGEIETLSRGELRIPLLLRDDYGVRDLQMRLDIDPSVLPRPQIGTFYDEIRAVMTKGGEDVNIQPVYNLAFHPWAGLPVKITFLATDDKGQAAILKPIMLTLPERTFNNEIAAHIIDVRKRLIADPDGDMNAIRDGLITIGSRPMLHGGDMKVHLALSAAIFRLSYSPGIDTARALVPLLWDVAVHIEDGDSSKALRDFQEARENLEHALNDPSVSDQQIAVMMEKLQEAMQRYFQEMARDMQRRMQDGAPPPMIPPELMANMITPQDLETFFAQLQARALDGDKDAAREMLSRLSRMMDMMDPSMNTSMPKDIQQMGDAINKLQDIIDGQKDLLDETRAHTPQTPNLPSTGDPVMDDILQKLGALQQPAQKAAPDPHAMEQGRGTQEELRGQLGTLMSDVGEAAGQVPENMGNAEQEMRGASAALGGKDPEQAASHQENAIKALEDAKEQLSQQLAQRLSQMSGFSMGSGGMKTDPLGRPYGQDQGKNPLLGEQVKIPDESDRKKIEDILQTLRKKSGDMTRPQDELEYYRRLLKQF